METRVMIKISAHPCYPKNFYWFSWCWSKKNVFLSRPFWNFFTKNFFFCFIPMKISQSFLGSKHGSILMIILVSNPKQHQRKDMQHSAVYIIYVDSNLQGCPPTKGVQNPVEILPNWWVSHKTSVWKNSLSDFRWFNWIYFLVGKIVKNTPKTKSLKEGNVLLF